MRNGRSEVRLGVGAVIEVDLVLREAGLADGLSVVRLLAGAGWRMVRGREGIVSRSGGRINVASGLTQIQMQKAQETLDLMGLQRTPNFFGGASDRRWMNRREAWDLAEQQKQTLTQIDTPTIRQMIVDMAKFRGYWSVWMTVFASNANMRSRLINGFTGSASNCFDASMNPVKRPGGAL